MMTAILTVKKFKKITIIIGSNTSAGNYVEVPSLLAVKNNSMFTKITTKRSKVLRLYST